jgi:hypothetical protein
MHLSDDRAGPVHGAPAGIHLHQHPSLDGRRILNDIQWERRELLQSAHGSPEFRKECTHFDDVTTNIDPHLYKVVRVAESKAIL